MKKVMVSTVLGIVSSALVALPLTALPLILLSSAAYAEREVTRFERPIVNHPVADAEAIRIARENADDDNDGIININDSDDDNDGIPDDDDQDDNDDDTSDDQDDN